MKYRGTINDAKDLITKEFLEGRINNTVTSTATDYALSANMGKTLQDEINNLKNIGRFLAVLDCSAGTVSSQPQGAVGETYAYKVGDYYRVGVAGNYTPKSTATYTIDSTSGSSNFETGATSYGIGDVIYCSNLTASASTWVKQGSSGGGTVQDVQVNGSSVLSGGVANIPIAGSTLGVVKPGSGLTINATTGSVSVNKASNSAVEGKSEAYNPIVPANLDKAIMEGLGNNSFTWSDAYKTSACNTIGTKTIDSTNDWSTYTGNSALVFVFDA